MLKITHEWRLLSVFHHLPLLIRLITYTEKLSSETQGVQIIQHFVHMLYGHA